MDEKLLTRIKAISWFYLIFLRWNNLVSILPVDPQLQFIIDLDEKKMTTWSAGFIQLTRFQG